MCFFALLVSLVMATLSARASGFLVRSWNNQEGLPDSDITSIVQTRDGYLWIGTGSGLVRFDGVRFVPFSAISGVGLDSCGVSKLFVARGGTLWVGLKDGHLFSWKSDTVHNYSVGNTSFNRAIVAMAQDGAGTLWIQTSDGELGRLTTNGIVFVARTGPTPRIGNLGLVVDAHNTLWVGTDKGLKVWQDGALVTPPGLESLHGPVDALARGTDDSVWTFQNRRLFKIKQKRIVAQMEAPAQFNGVAVGLQETDDHGVWLAALDGSMFYLKPNRFWQTIPTGNVLCGPNPTLCEDHEGDLWCGSIGGDLIQFRPKVFNIFGAGASSGYSVILSFNGSTNWAKGTNSFVIDNVLLRTVSAQRPVTNYWQDFNAASSTANSVGWNGGFAYSGADFESHAICATGIDGTGGLVTTLNITDGPNLGAFTEFWSQTLILPAGANPDNLSLTAQVADSQTGVPFSLRLNDHCGHYIDFNGTIHHTGTFQNVGGLLSTANYIDPGFRFSKQNLNRYALSVCSDAAGNVWMQPNGNAVAQISADRQNPQVKQEPSLPQVVHTIFVDRRNSLWAGTEGGYLYHLHNGAFVLALRVNNADSINALFEDARSNLWVGFSGGAGVGVLPQCNPSHWHVVRGLAVPDVRAIAQASDGSIWLGTSGGAFRLKDRHWNRFTTRDGLPSDYVRCLHTEPDGTVWLGTLHGLCRWRNGKFTAITTKDGLWNDSISYIEEDGRSNLWMSSFGGIFRVSRQELNEFAEGKRMYIECVGYNRNDGLPSDECPGGFQPAGTRTPDGRIWFPTEGGLVSIDPDHIAQNVLVPPVYLEEIIVDGDPHSIESKLATLEIPPGKTQFEFRFTALSLQAPEKVFFRYKLEGFNSAWSKPDRSRAAVYSHIPPGHYKFCVIACNNDGCWNTTGASIGLVVQPFYWQTVWFKSITIVGLALTLIWGGWRMERRHARMRLERLEQKHALERERTRIARDIHDELGANLTQIVFLSEKADSVPSNKGQMENCHRRIRSAAQSSIQSLDEIVWAVSPEHDTLESLANYLTQFVREYPTLTGMRCHLEVPTVLPPLYLSAEVRHNLLMAIREAVQNVVSHSAATELQVALQLSNEVLEITIADNGRGFKLELPNAHGHGLTNMHRRLAQIGGQCTILSQPGTGTTIQFCLSRKCFQVNGRHMPSSVL